MQGNIPISSVKLIEMQKLHFPSSSKFEDPNGGLMFAGWFKFPWISQQHYIQ